MDACHNQDGHAQQRPFTFLKLVRFSVMFWITIKGNKHLILISRTKIRKLNTIFTISRPRKQAVLLTHFPPREYGNILTPDLVSFDLSWVTFDVLKGGMRIHYNGADPSGDSGCTELLPALLSYWNEEAASALS